jgi:pyruvate dehydrogenase E2 component (dihydrolipoamide acetyltransferase)
MAHILIMPRQGNTVESCVIGEWKVAEGAAVAADTPVCVVETDKATFEVPAGAAGTVLKIIHPAGDDVPVLQPIAAIGSAGEDWAAAVEQPLAGSLPPTADTTAAIPSPAASPAAAPAASPVPAGGFVAASPRAKVLANEEAVDLRALAGTGPAGRIIAPDVAAAAAGRPPLTAAAKDDLRARIAAGLPATAAGPGSGIGGRLTLADIEAGSTPAASTDAAPTAADVFTDTPIKGIRKLIAEQMMASHSGTAAFTLNAGAPAVNLLHLRARFKASDPALGLNTITINDLVLFAVSRVLPAYPFMNAHKLGGTIRSWSLVHLGVAVAAPRGLMVPVIRNAGALSLTQISARARALAAACRAGSIAPEDLHGSTFTVTNLGNTGVDSFTPVINIPEAAILGVSAIAPRPAETDGGRYEILPHLGLSLTIDHAIVDGAPAAEFFKALRDAIENIDILLAR